MKGNRLWLIVAAAVCVFLTSCATSIPVKVMKPAEITLPGSHNIALLDFTYPSYNERALSGYTFHQKALALFYGYYSRYINPDERKVSVLLRDSITRNLISTGTISVFRPNDVLTGLNADRAMELSLQDLGAACNADIFFIGEITHMSIRTDSKKITEKVNGRNVSATEYERIAELSFSYRVIDVLSGKVVATRSFNQSRTDTKRQQNSLTSPDSMYAEMIETISGAVQKQLAPYTVTEYRTLMADKTKNPRMKEADELVKMEMYEKAIKLYLDIYDKTGNVAAGFNAGIMYEVSGDLDRAIDFMTEVLDDTLSKEVKRELERMKRTRQDNELSAAQS